MKSHEAALGHGEDEVQVFEVAALGLLDEEEDEDEGEYVEGAEEGEGAAVVEAGDDAARVSERWILGLGGIKGRGGLLWEEDGEKASKEEVGRDGPRGALLCQ